MDPAARGGGTLLRDWVVPHSMGSWQRSVIAALI
jgi:hypothetical protein